MDKKYNIITLCGSAKFKEEFLREKERLTLAGNIVLTPVFFESSVDFDTDTIAMLKDMHFRKIDMADEIFVINKDGYIGSSTSLEIEYAKKNHKKVNYMEPMNK